jgi:chromosomal replication initiator protein
MVSELSRIFLVQQLAAGRRAARESVEPDELATRALRCVEEFVDKWSRQNVVSLKQVSQAVAEYFGIRPVELKGPSRRQMVLRARGVAIYLGRHLAGESLDRLGAHFGGRDHSTALHAVRKTEELLAEDPILRKAVDDLERRLRSDGEP